jgi:hypothetical protein
MEIPEVNGTAQAVLDCPPPVVWANMGMARNIIASIRKNILLFIIGVTPLMEIVFRRWLRSSPEGGRPHTENGIMPVSD